jgi:hypothetical protein
MNWKSGAQSAIDPNSTGLDHHPDRFYGKDWSPTLRNHIEWDKYTAVEQSLQIIFLEGAWWGCSTNALSDPISRGISEQLRQASVSIHFHCKGLKQDSLTLKARRQREEKSELTTVSESTRRLQITAGDANSK